MDAFMEKNELSLSEVLKVLLRRWWILALAALIGAAVAFLYVSYAVTPVYRAETKYYVDAQMVVDQNSVLDHQRSMAYSMQIMPSYVDVLNTGNFAERVYQTIKERSLPLSREYTANDLLSSIEIVFANETVANTASYIIRVLAYSPEDAKAIADLISEISNDYIAENITNSENTVKIIDKATLPRAPINVSKTRALFLGFLAGLFLTGLLLVFFEINDVRVKNEDMLAKEFGLPIIGAIPRLSQQTTSDKN